MNEWFDTDHELLNLQALLNGREPCASTADADLYWFSDPSDTDAQVEALVACQGCHVLDECAAYAIAHPAVTGVWGGTTEADRDALRAAFRRNARRVAS